MFSWYVRLARTHQTEEMLTSIWLSQSILLPLSWIDLMKGLETFFYLRGFIEDVVKQLAADVTGDLVTSRLIVFAHFWPTCPLQDHVPSRKKTKDSRCIDER